MLHQLGDWLAGPSELVVMAPLHIAAIVVLVRVTCGDAPIPGCV